jgi:uncharacterized protein (DUF1778 family)
MTTDAIANETINLRVPATKKSLIDRAAKTVRESRSSFILEASIHRAETVLADRTHLVLSEEQLAKFQQALDAPLPDTAALLRLLTRPSPWDK